MVSENQHLADLAERLGGGPPGWRGHVESASGPVELNRAAELLRDWWLEQCRAPSRRLFRSPFYSEPKPLPLGGEALFTYERSLWPVPLEHTVVPQGWEGEVVVCRNLAACYWTTVATLRDLADAPIQARSWNVSQRLLALLQGARWNWSEAFTQTTFHSSVEGGRAGLFLVGAQGWDVEEWLQAWHSRPPGSDAVLGIDVTWAPLFDWQGLLRRLLPDPPGLTFFIRGWQPWDSGGLELSPPGSVTFAAPAAPGMSQAALAGELARRARSVLGTALTLPELGAWTPDFGDRSAYIERLFDNAAHVPQELVRPDWPDLRRRAASLGVLEGEGYGGLAHRFWATPEGELRVSAGWRDCDSLLQLLRGGGGRLSSSERPSPVSQVTWPEAREALLQTADSTLPQPLAALEARLLDYDRAPAGWALEPLLFRSAMSALSSLWLALEGLTGPTPERPLRVACLGRYFETKFLETLVQGAGVVQAVELEQADVVFAESVDYDWELTPLDLGRLGGVRGLVLDTTLTGQALGIERVATELPGLAYVIRVFSALKLDQAGLELENCGAVLISAPEQVAGQLASALRLVREETGGAPSDAELRRWSPPLVLNAPQARLHGDAVFSNNAALAVALRPCCGGLLARVAHPAGGGLPWARAPFVVLHLSDDSVDKHRLFAAVIEHEATQRGLPLRRGASFGFVDHRFEFIIPVLKENRALFKVAMGARQDDSAEGVAQLLRELLSYPGWAALAAAYAQVPLAQPAADWAAPSERMLAFLEGSE